MAQTVDAPRLFARGLWWSWVTPSWNSAFKVAGDSSATDFQGHCLRFGVGRIIKEQNTLSTLSKNVWKCTDRKDRTPENHLTVEGWRWWSGEPLIWDACCLPCPCSLGFKPVALCGHWYELFIISVCQPPPSQSPEEDVKKEIDPDNEVSHCCGNNR